MEFVDTELASLIQLIAEEVADALSKASRIPKRTADPEAIVLVMGHIPRYEEAGKSIQALCGDQAKIYLLNDAAFPDNDFVIEAVSNREQQDALLDTLTGASCVLLVAPPLRQLKNVCQGNDEGYAETVVLKAILWGKDVQVLLDFDPPKFKRGPLFESLMESMDILAGMGVKINTYQAAANGGVGETDLVTEDQVVNAYKSGRTTVYASKGAIITPLAKDKAKELKINIE